MIDIQKFYLQPGEEPLDVIKPDGGFAGIFRTIAVVGDSLSSGEFEATNEQGGKSYHDIYDQSWGAYIARATGAKVHVFARSGMTAKEYLSCWGYANGAFERDKAAQAYIFAMGFNDMFSGIEKGSAADIDVNDPSNNKESFTGLYGSIIQKYKAIEPRAKFFLLTMPRETMDDSDPREAVRKHHAEILHSLAALFDNTYVIDLWKYGPMQDSRYRENFYLGGHLTAGGYLLTAQMVMSYIDYIIRSNPEDFAQVGFIGTPFYNKTRK